MPPTSSTNRSNVHKNPTRNSSSRADMNNTSSGHPTSSGDLQYSQRHRLETLFDAEPISTSASSHARRTDAPSNQIAHSTHIAADRIQAHVNRLERVFDSERAVLWKEGLELRRDVQALLWEHRHVDLSESSDTTGTVVETQTESAAVERPHGGPSAQAHSGFVSMWGLPDVSPDTNTAGSKHPPSPHTRIYNTEIKPRAGNTVTEATEEPTIREQPAIQKPAPKKRKTSG
ncbi:hypothetical protein C8R43DRAFT_1244170 [Mycena crocata]|nr:hypothetical protein C8R43DRAFT_1244170 [Mycena crocata]